jgi:DNA-binding transcriptional MocR family regulator
VGGVHGYCVRAATPAALILGYGMLRDSAIAEGVKRLATVIERR